ncbi:sterile alpha motif domain-containing protein 13 [Orycteropus afer afer]|uniref:Sterile alpha motif domain-containing protein 13 n=1 Tax=Orycteropus afer afer TaxID=1230840 RepID=A0AC54ZCG2_ORYAF|nr:sterile alpha motif domain-containing protein 13 [Orycteropus afer afer]
MSRTIEQTSEQGHKRVHIPAIDPLSTKSTNSGITGRLKRPQWLLPPAPQCLIYNPPGPFPPPADRVSSSAPSSQTPAPPAEDYNSRGARRLPAAELHQEKPLAPAVRGVAEVKEPCRLPMLSVDMENKENGSVGVKNSMENGRPPDPADWAVMDVVNYFRTVGFEEQASAFQEQEIDGKSLLLMTRNDVLTGLQLKLGPALKIYEYHVKPLQTKHLKNNSS